MENNKHNEENEEKIEEYEVVINNIQRDIIEIIKMSTILNNNIENSKINNDSDNENDNEIDFYNKLIILKKKKDITINNLLLSIHNNINNLLNIYYQY